MARCGWAPTRTFSRKARPSVTPVRATVSSGWIARRGKRCWSVCATRTSSLCDLSRKIADFPLGTQRQYSNLVELYHEAVQRDVARGAEGNNQFAQVTLDASANERVFGKDFAARGDGFDGAARQVLHGARR